MKNVRKSVSGNRIADGGRQQIVDAARAHFFSHGFRGVTMDDLAEEIGVSRKTPQAYFPGKKRCLKPVKGQEKHECVS
jgi:AcrR family transcriptional regulator